MTPIAYYNEPDLYAAQWLRNLIAGGHIAFGYVDERSIEDVLPDELAGYTQHHFFAGIGVWSLALRQAGWPDDRPIWTGSCPCQPFSAAGAGAGFHDERHLWPAFQHLIAQRKPSIVVGEQVASKASEPWLDLVHADMEAMDYAFGCVAFPSAGVGAPHIRDRLYWVGVGQADPNDSRLEGRFGVQERTTQFTVGSSSLVERVGNADSFGAWRYSRAVRSARDRKVGQQRTDNVGASGGDERLADNNNNRLASMSERDFQNSEHHAQSRGSVVGLGESASGRLSRVGNQSTHSELADTSSLVLSGSPGPTSGFWRDADWLHCRDGKWRPVEPGTFPLAHGARSRVGRLRAYGNALNAEAATEFIRILM